MSWFSELFARNPSLFVFGLFCFGGVLSSALLVQATNVEVLGINAWIKPFKFFLSAGIFVWTMAWYTGYLPEKNQVLIYSWVVIAVFAFELFYISWQAARGELSHFNASSAFHSQMFSLMGVAISIMTLWTAYIGLLFFKHDFPTLPVAYVWGIRLGIIMFVIFAFEGGMMGARMAHTVGGADGSDGLPLVNWSKSLGDLRVAHFFGMHALQILPLAGYFVFTSTKSLVSFSVVYFLLVSATLLQALLKMPFLKG